MQPLFRRLMQPVNTSYFFFLNYLDCFYPLQISHFSHKSENDDAW